MVCDKRVLLRANQDTRQAGEHHGLPNVPPVPLRSETHPARAPQRAPSWSPDGDWIAYYAIRDGKPAVLKAKVGANGPADVLTYAAGLRSPPRGDWIAFGDDGKLRIVSSDGYLQLSTRDLTQPSARYRPPTQIRDRLSTTDRARGNRGNLPLEADRFLWPFLWHDISIVLIEVQSHGYSQLGNEQRRF